MSEVSLSQPIPVEERIPESAKYEKLAAGSIIRGRRVVRWQPSTGTSVNSTGGSQIITFRLSDSNSYLDPLSCYLAFKVDLTQGTFATNGGVAWDDTVLSFFNRVRAEFNGADMDDIVDNDALSHALLYALGDKHAYCQDLGLQAGSWKWNDLNYGTTNDATGAADGTFEGPSNRGGRFFSTLYTISGTDDPAEADNHDALVQFAVPLSYFNIGVFKQSKFLPMRNLGILRIDFHTNTANRALRTGVADVGSSLDLQNHVGIGGASFLLENLSIVGQVLDLDPRYLEVMDRIATTSETGLVMDFSTFTTLKQTYPSNASSTEKSLALSKASTSIRNMYIVRQPASWREDPGYSSITGFPNMDCEGFRVQINSLYIPTYGSAESPLEQYNLGRQAHALLGNQDALGNIRKNGYISGANAASDINGQHVLAVGFEKSTNQYMAMDGLNTTSSGGLITVFIKDAGSTDAGGPGLPINFTAWIEYTRFLQLRQNAVSVNG